MVGESLDSRINVVIDKIIKKFEQTPVIEHKCHNCGGTLEINVDKVIFTCPYCHSCYAVGTTRINEV